MYRNWQNPKSSNSQYDLNLNAYHLTDKEVFSYEVELNREDSENPLVKSINEIEQTLNNVDLVTQLQILQNLPFPVLNFWTQCIKNTILFTHSINNISLKDLIILAQIYRSFEGTTLAVIINPDYFYKVLMTLEVNFTDLVDINASTITKLQALVNKVGSGLINIKFEELLTLLNTENTKAQPSNTSLTPTMNNYVQSITELNFLNEFNQTLAQQDLDGQLQILQNLEQEALSNLAQDVVKKVKILQSDSVTRLFGKVTFREIISFKELIILAKQFKDSREAEKYCRLNRKAIVTVLTNFGLVFTELSQLNTESINKLKNLATECSESITANFLHIDLKELSTHLHKPFEIKSNFYRFIQLISSKPQTEIAIELRLKQHQIQQIAESSEFKKLLQYNFPEYYSNTKHIVMVCRDVCEKVNNFQELVNTEATNRNAEETQPTVEISTTPAETQCEVVTLQTESTNTLIQLDTPFIIEPQQVVASNDIEATLFNTWSEDIVKGHTIARYMIGAQSFDRMTEEDYIITNILSQITKHTYYTEFPLGNLSLATQIKLIKSLEFFDNILDQFSDQIIDNYYGTFSKKPYEKFNDLTLKELCILTRKYKNLKDLASIFSISEQHLIDQMHIMHLSSKEIFDLNAETIQKLHKNINESANIWEFKIDCFQNKNFNIKDNFPAVLASIIKYDRQSDMLIDYGLPQSQMSNYNYLLTLLKKYFESFNVNLTSPIHIDFNINNTYHAFRSKCIEVIHCINWINHNQALNQQALFEGLEAFRNDAEEEVHYTITTRSDSSFTTNTNMHLKRKADNSPTTARHRMHKTHVAEQDYIANFVSFENLYVHPAEILNTHDSLPVAQSNAVSSQEQTTEQRLEPQHHSLAKSRFTLLNSQDKQEDIFDELDPIVNINDLN